LLIRTVFPIASLRFKEKTINSSIRYEPVKPLCFEVHAILSSWNFWIISFQSLKRNLKGISNRARKDDPKNQVLPKYMSISAFFLNFFFFPRRPETGHFLRTLRKIHPLPTIVFFIFCKTWCWCNATLLILVFKRRLQGFCASAFLLMCSEESLLRQGNLIMQRSLLIRKTLCIKPATRHCDTIRWENLQVLPKSRLHSSSSSLTIPVAFYTREVSVPGSDETIKFPCLISHMQASKHYIDYLASIPSKLRVCRTLFFIYFNYFFDDRQRARGGLSNAVVDDDFNNFELLNSLISRLKQNVPKDLQVWRINLSLTHARTHSHTYIRVHTHARAYTNRDKQWLRFCF
jgi:hypothetical protein